MRRGGDWMKGVDLWESVTGFDTRRCGVGLGWGASRCCPVLGIMID